MLQILLLAAIQAVVKGQGFNEYRDTLILCDGIWGQNSIPFAKQQSKVNVQVTPFSDSGSLTLAVFRFEDRFHFEAQDGNRNSYKICYPNRVKSEECTEKELGKFIISNETLANFQAPVLNEAVHWHKQLAKMGLIKAEDIDEFMEEEDEILKRQVDNSTEVSATTSASAPSSTPSHVHTIHNSEPSDQSFEYLVQDSGYYCVLAVRDDQEYLQDFQVTMIVTNPYGLLPAIFFPAFPFFCTQLAAYLVIGLVWLAASLRNRHELLRIQNLMGATIVFLVLENVINTLFFMDFNRNGYVSRPFLAIMVAFNAGRNSLSFFMILLVSLGYGVVYPSLGKKMYLAVALCIVNFVCGALYYTTQMQSKDVNAVLVFLLGLPFAVTLFIFYVWILLGINQTIEHLQEKRQSVKLLMYKRLSQILTTSVAILAVIFVINTINAILRRDPGWVANNFKFRWLLMDGLLNVNYFIAFVSIAYLWLPTDNNSRLSLEQLQSDDIDDIPGHRYEDMEMNAKAQSPSDEQVLDWATRNLAGSPGTTERLVPEEIVFQADDEVEVMN